MWLAPIMHLEPERMLDEIALLLPAVGNKDAPIADFDAIGIEANRQRQFAHGPNGRPTMCRGAGIDLGGGADIADVRYPIMAIIIRAAMSVGDAA